jgi:hypothetical protein
MTTIRRKLERWLGRRLATLLPEHVTRALAWSLVNKVALRRSEWVKTGAEGDPHARVYDSSLRGRYTRLP